MPKTIADYRDHIGETMKAFDEYRVLLVSHGKEGPPNAMAIGWGDDRSHMAETNFHRPPTTLPLHP